MNRAKSSQAVIQAGTPSDNGHDKRGDAVSTASPYSAAKTLLDTPMHKYIRSHALWMRNKVVGFLQRERSGQLLALTALAVTLTLLLAGVHQNSKHTAPRQRHVVLLDAGSTGTRVHIFTYLPAPTRGAYAHISLPEPKLKVQPGLSAFAADPTQVAASLAPLIEFAAAHVPAAVRAATPVRLMGTAGLRLLPEPQVEALLAACRAVLGASGFRFLPEWAAVISGEKEGLYGWTAANYASGTLQEAATSALARKGPRDYGRFVGLLELGGASAQVTFLPERQDQTRDAPHLRLPGVTRRVFTHSFLGLGFDAVESRLVRAAAEHWRQQHPDAAQRGAGSGGNATQDPCLPNGYTSEDGRHGTGDWQHCRRLVAQLLDPASCAPPPSHCARRPHNMPRVSRRLSLVATENFYYTAAALQLPEHATLAELAAAADAFCGRRWEETLGALTAAAHSHPGQQLLHRYCFGSAFVWTLLHDVFQIESSAKLRFANSLQRADGTEVGLDWALGAVVLEASKEAAAEAPEVGGGDAGRAWRARVAWRLLVLAGVLAGLVLGVVLLGLVTDGAGAGLLGWDSTGMAIKSDL